MNSIRYAEDKANFIKIILTWWKIVDVKTPLKGKRLKDLYQEYITCQAGDDDPKIVFLQRMLNWLEIWKNSNEFPKALTSQTFTDLHHTAYGVLEVDNRCNKYEYGEKERKPNAIVINPEHPVNTYFEVQTKLCEKPTYFLFARPRISQNISKVF